MCCIAIIVYFDTQSNALLSANMHALQALSMRGKITLQESGKIRHNQSEFRQINENRSEILHAY